jgi:uncharacterized protein YuzE
VDAVISPDFIQHLLSFPARQMWTDYDAQADVLYISFRKPQQANDSIMEDDGNIYHYHDSELVGITVLHASRQSRSTDQT